MIDSYKNDVINLQWINYVTINDKLWKEKCRFTQKINVVTGEWKRQWLENDMQLWRKVELETVWKQWEDTSDNVYHFHTQLFSWNMHILHMRPCLQEEDRVQCAWPVISLPPNKNHVYIKRSSKVKEPLLARTVSYLFILYPSSTLYTQGKSHLSEDINKVVCQHSTV